MELTFGINTSAPYVSYKSVTSKKNLKDDSVKVKDPCEVLSPVLLIKKGALGKNWSAYNYVEIPMFNRKYFATYTAERGGLLEFQCKVDVLSTYIDKLIGTSFETERAYSSNKGDSLLFADVERPIQINKKVEAPPSQRLLTIPQNSGGSYILTVAGGAATP